MEDKFSAVVFIIITTTKNKNTRVVTPYQLYQPGNQSSKYHIQANNRVKNSSFRVTINYQYSNTYVLKRHKLPPENTKNDSSIFQNKADKKVALEENISWRVCVTASQRGNIKNTVGRSLMITTHRAQMQW